MPKVVPEYKEEAKTRIIEAANRIFADKGYHEATMDDVAKQLGVSKGALYLYFPSKVDLFEEMSRNSPI
ncbi:MAG TPA: helix-turn-helix domain-containing protein, partial [Candidatus Dormibacteraeota bacterium]|nr:helix-turn-helix domain-containing protein [Candidatus Dormibacteraeota bacterium]